VTPGPVTAAADSIASAEAFGEPTMTTHSPVVPGTSKRRYYISRRGRRYVR
jgi:hypothetical protein